MLRVEAKNYVLLREYNLPAPQPDPPQPSLKGRESSPFKGELEGVWLWDRLCLQLRLFHHLSVKEVDDAVGKAGVVL